MRCQRDGAQSIEVSRITLVSVGIRQQCIGVGQVIFTLEPVPSGCGCRIFLMNIFIVKHCRIATVYHIAKQTESRIHIKMYGQKLILASHLSHSHLIIKTEHLGTPGKAYFTYAPHIVAHNHITAYKLETLALRHKPDTEFAIVRLAHYGIYIIGIVLFRIGGQWGEKFVVQ